ncbi:hypothetical protein PHYSODRAFT_299745 [Phytophthora sojae]|uniref:Uncharacterized protein n=1 Tax=Phytophthora sojae (strain P6497) TaxID=1094619 RepID=G4Z794_PHYSP|nr:hypothetical protein PHYSODRAFT_299745 [Phytophthora sojae]EGZ22478.1 hypothetical protein PHYSODRAFT_299745 [Phytophthora sojae]|eukprot:XP_009525195.1 hypothetical protein PHYSODRAFT_299745 [Phytophthora sojae]
MAERETKMCKLLAYLFAKPPVDPSPELYRRLQNASSIDELLPALEGQVVDGPQPAAVAGEKAAEAFAERTRADLLQHNLCEAAKEIAALREAAATSDALARSLKEEAARVNDSSNEGQLSMQLLDTERKSFLAEKQLLEATIRDKDRLIAAQVDDYRRNAGNRQLVIGRCYELSTQSAQLSDTILKGRWRQLADKDHTIRTFTRCKKFTSLVSGFQKQSPFLAAAAMHGQPMPGLEADQLEAFRDASNLLRQAGLGVFGEVEQHVQNPSPTPTAPPPSRPREVHAQESDNDSEVLGEAPVVLSVDDAPAGILSTPVGSSMPSTEEAVTSGVTEEVGETLEDPVAVESSPGGFTSRVPAKSPAPSSASEAPTEELYSSAPATPVVGETSPATQLEATSTLASLSSEAPPTLTTSSVMIRPAAPPGKPDADSESKDGDQQQASPGSQLPDPSSTTAASSVVADHGDEDSSSAESALKSTMDSTGKAPVMPAGPSKKVPVKTASAPASKKKKSSAKVVKSAKSASLSSSSAAKTPVGESKPEIVRVKLEGGPPPHLVDVKTLVQRASNATSRDSRESKYMKRLRSLPFFHKASRRCWEKIFASCVPIAVTEKTADGVRIQPTPISLTGLHAFAKVDDPNHPWRAIFRLLPRSMVFVDDTVLNVFPPVEKGKRSRKAGTVLEALSLALCRSRGVRLHLARRGMVGLPADCRTRRGVHPAVVEVEGVYPRT